jgi:hypothetical protein
MGGNRTPKTVRRKEPMTEQTQPDIAKDNRQLAILSPKTGSALTFSSTS